MYSLDSQEKVLTNMYLVDIHAVGQEQEGRGQVGYRITRFLKFEPQLCDIHKLINLFTVETSVCKMRVTTPAPVDG